MLTFRFLVFFAIIACVIVIFTVTTQPDGSPVEASPQGVVLRVVTWQGWGTALAWWPNLIAPLDHDHQQHILKLVFSPDKGLGLNIVRYVIPGGANFTLSPQLSSFAERTVPGFLPSPAGGYNWSADARQRDVLLAAKAYGANVFDAVSYSPPWWMTMSGDVGGGEGGSANIAEANLRPYARYLASVVERYSEDWGVRFSTLAPFNEPLQPWWVGSASIQEGCAFERDMILPFLHMIRRELDVRGMTDVGVSGIEEWMDATKSFVDDWQEDRHALDVMTRLQVHAYTSPTYFTPRQLEMDQMVALRGSADQLGFDIWQSEWGILKPRPSNLEDLPASLLLARSICEHINVLGVVAWSHWQAVEYCGGGPCSETWRQQFGLIRIPQPFNETQPLFLSKQYYVTMHFSRWIRPGFEVWQVMGSLERYMTTAIEKDRSKLIIVAVNQGDEDAMYQVEPTTIQLMCTGEHEQDRMVVTRYITSQDEDHSLISEDSHEGMCVKPYAMKLPAASVMTTIISKTV